MLSPFRISYKSPSPKGQARHLLGFPSSFASPDFGNLVSSRDGSIDLLFAKGDVLNIQIFGTLKCQETKKAQRYFKERRIPFQFTRMAEQFAGEQLLGSVGQ